MTLNGRNDTLAEIKQFYGAHHKNFDEDRSTLHGIVICENVSHGQRSRSRDGSIISVSAIISIIVAFSGRVP